MPPSMALTAIQPCAWLDTSTKCGEVLKSTAPHLSPTQAPSPWLWLSQSDDSADSQGHCHHCHFTPELPQAGDAAAELGTFLHGPEAEDSLQTKDSAVATLSPCRDHWDTHLLVLLLQAWAAPEAVPSSSPPLQGRPNPKISLGVMWLFWLFGLHLGCALGRECQVQCPIYPCLHINFLSIHGIIAGQCQSVLYFNGLNEWK